jgi:PHP family Zn ribbon phosphoesterase
LEKVTQPEIAQGIINAREGKVELTAGYDGVFGHVKVGNTKSENKTKEIPTVTPQKKLF